MQQSTVWLSPVRASCDVFQRDRFTTHDNHHSEHGPRRLLQSSSPVQLDFWEQMDELTPSNAFECTKTLLAANALASL